MHPCCTAARPSVVSQQEEAAAMTHWGPDMKDRQVRMLPHQTVNAPASKDGAGGNYTWGTPMDSMQFQPLGDAPAQSKVILQAAPQYVQAPAQQMTCVIADSSHFPTLGAAQPIAVPQWGPPGGAVHTQAIQVSPQVLQSVAPIRTNVDFGQQRPRNTFAKRPVTMSTPVAQTQPMAIDWSQAGTSCVQQALLHMPNPSHTGPYQVQHSPVPLNVLQATPQPMQIAHYQTPSQQVNYTNTPRYQTRGSSALQARGR